MEYRQFVAPADLAPWVECAWTLRGAPLSAGQMILPDGRLELIFHFAEPPASQSPSLVAGRMLRGLTLPPKSQFHSLGIRLRPGGAHAFLPCDKVGEAEDLEAVIGIWAKQTRERLAQTNLQIESLWPLLRRLKVSPADDAVQSSVAAIESARGRGPIDAFLPQGLQTRQWQRRFLRTTGFTPKAFARIVRLQSTISLATSQRHLDWSALAIESGFYDQAHLNNEFRAFTGATPAQYFAQQYGMAEFYLASTNDAFFQDENHNSR